MLLAAVSLVSAPRCQALQLHGENNSRSQNDFSSHMHRNATPCIDTDPAMRAEKAGEQKEGKRNRGNTISSMSSEESMVNANAVNNF